jgi:hypothetical protein
MQVIKAPVMAKALDEIEVENALAYLLDSVAGGLYELAEELRRSPYIAIEQRLKSRSLEVAMMLIVGRCIKEEEFFSATTLINKIQLLGVESLIPNLTNEVEWIGDSEAIAQLERLLPNRPGQIRQLCPNCGHDIGDFSECGNCFHSL